MHDKNISWCTNGGDIFDLRVIKLELINGSYIELIIKGGKEINYNSKEWHDVVNEGKKKGKLYDPKIIMKNIPSLSYNCHGFSLANRRGWLNEPETVITSDGFSLLTDDNYVLCGDLVCYINAIGKVSHTAIVLGFCGLGFCRKVTVKKICEKRKNCYVVSKWGALGEYIHDIMKCPYTTSDFSSLKFYRFERANHG